MKGINNFTATDREEKEIKCAEFEGEVLLFLNKMRILGRGAVSQFIREAVEEKYNQEKDSFEEIIKEELLRIVEEVEAYST